MNYSHWYFIINNDQTSPGYLTFQKDKVNSMLGTTTGRGTIFTW